MLFRSKKMIQTIACYISKWNKEKLGLSENERKVIEFGMEVFLDGCVKIIVLLSIAFAFNRVKEFAVCLVCFCGLRYWAGGIHCKTTFRCLLAMILLCLLSVYTGEYISGIISAPSVINYLWGTCILIGGIKAPGQTTKAFTEEQIWRKKAATVLFIIFLWGISVVLKGSYLRNIMLISVIFEMLSILPCKRNKI